MVIRKYNAELRPDIAQDVLECIRLYDHTDWYWKLIELSGCTEDSAYELTVAMHLETRVPFDYGICTLTPYSPWPIPSE